MSAPLLNLKAAQAVGLVTSAYLAGAISSISIISIEPLKLAPPQVLARQWKALFDLGKARAPPVGAIASSAFGYCAYNAYKIAGPKSRIFILYILATVLPLGIAPFTFTAMASTNNALLAKADKYATTPVWEKAVPGAEEGDEGVEALVQKWKGLNLIRSLMPSAAAVLGAVAIFGGL